jgi:hypothetical protein
MAVKGIEIKRENIWKEHMQYHFEERIQFACSLIDFNQVSSINQPNLHL